MEKLYHPDNLKKLAECISRAAADGNDDDLDSLLNVLKVLICGPPGERCQSFYGQAIPHDRCVAAVMGSRSTRNALKSNGDACDKMFRMFLNMPYLTFHLCRAFGILLSCTPSEELKREMAGCILSHSDLYKFDPKAVLLCLNLNPTELELLLIKLCTQEITEFNEEMGHWVRWCAQSSEIFLVVASTLAEIFVKLNDKRQALSGIAVFLNALKKTCDRDQIDLSSLYPAEIQLLVELMSMDPQPARDQEQCEFVLKRAKVQFFSLVKNSPMSALMLTTHFPEWIIHLEKSM